MRPSKAHFVTSCQQLLALGVVLAVLTPAASVVSLDVVRTPGSAPVGTPVHEPDALPAPQQPRAPGDRAEDTSKVPTAPVDAVVHEVALTPQRKTARPEQADPPATRKAPAAAEELTRTTVLSEPQKVTGYGAVGVTWSHGEEVDDDRIRLQVRTATDGAWGGWDDLEYHDEHAPDATTEEARGTRPGTDPLFVGEVDQVQLRAVSQDGLPDDMSLAVVAPGQPTAVDEESPAGNAQEDTPDAAGEAGDAGDGGDDGAIELQAASTTAAPQPKIFTREQWGANERLRSGRPSYGTISAGFVHHTVNSNTYSRDDVPGMLRSIYAYHTQSRGWSDIGYNFLVDKFGRIWEGRYGGIARPVVGAHTLGYNGQSFAMSAIGNYETAQPSEAMLKAYGALFAWKLGLAGVDPADMSRNVNGDTFAAINGHRDAGSTACPGRHLYTKIPAIRRYAVQAGNQEPEPPKPDPVTLQQVDTDLASTPHPDLVVRRASDKQGMILPTGGLSKFLAPRELGGGGWAGRTLLATPDLTGDGVADAVTFDERGRMEVRPGPASEGYRTVQRKVRAFRGHDLVASTGDLDGDGRADFVARAKKRLVTFRGNARGGFAKLRHDITMGGYVQLVGAGDVTGDGRADLWGRDKLDRVWLHPGKGNGRFGNRIRVAGDWSDLDSLAGGTDLTADGIPDLVVRRTNGTLLVLPARGDGTVGRALKVGSAPGVTSLTAAGQLTGNEAPDLLAVGKGGVLTAIPNRGTFDLGRAIDTGQSFSRGNLLLNAGDFDGDGNGDVIVRRKVGSLWLYRGRGNGKLRAPVWIGGKKPFRNVTGLRVVADVTGDKRHDLVGTVDGTTYVWPGAGGDRLGKRQPIDVAPDTARKAVRAAAYDWVVPTSDLQRKGLADLVVRDKDGYVYRLNGVRSGYGPPRYLGEAGGYDLAG